MLTILRAIAAALSYGWWSFTIFCGGPLHGSYIHAIWRRWQARAQLKLFLDGRA